MSISKDHLLKQKIETYSIREGNSNIYDMLNTRLIGSDIILMLLLISPVKGSTRMQKQVFLTWKEVFNDIALDPAFFPWKYGAFSKVVEDTITVLEKQKLISVHKRKGEGSLFLITERGRNKIKDKISKIGVELDRLRTKKIDWDEWSPRGTLRYVYRNYPQYTSKTEVPSLKW